MSTPTVSSLAADRSLDQSMGWSAQTSGGRGKKGYEMTLTRRQEERKKEQAKLQAKHEKVVREQNKTKVTELLRKADAGELDWM